MKEELYIKLLQKELSSGLSPSEKTSLNDWLNQSSENRLIAKSIRKGWELSEGYSKDLDVDLEADFSKLNARINESETKVIQMKPSRRWLNIAAAVLVLVASIFGISRYLQEDLNWVSLSTSEYENKSLTLLDGTVISLNQNSFFEYPENFNSKERRVKLTGEAFFEVEHNPDHPFIIEGKNGETTVLGTSFNVRNYDFERKTIVTVRSGKVRFSPKGTDQKIDLVANEKTVFDVKKGTLIRSEDKRLVDLNWYSKTFDFNDIPMQQALEEIGKAYDVELSIENKNLKSCPLTANYEKLELTQIFQFLEVAYGMKFEKTAPRKYKVVGGGC